jgi:hypothetical protein
MPPSINRLRAYLPFQAVHSSGSTAYLQDQFIDIIINPFDVLLYFYTFNSI